MRADGHLQILGFLADDMQKIGSDRAHSSSVAPVVKSLVVSVFSLSMPDSFDTILSAIVLGIAEKHGIKGLGLLMAEAQKQMTIKIVNKLDGGAK